jgi:hypothetical protein
MQLPTLMIGTREVQDMISGGTASEWIPDPIACLLRAETTGWRVDGCRFLASQGATEAAHDDRERAYLLEAAGMQLASVFDVLLHEVVQYYGLSAVIPPKKVRWEAAFEKRLAASDADLTEMLKSVQQELWFRKIKGLRHFLTHHGCLLQLIEVHIGNDEQQRAYRVPGDEYFEQEGGVLPPDSFTTGNIDRCRLPHEIIEGLENMCRLVDRVRQHCFEHAPAFHWGRVRRQNSG